MRTMSTPDASSSASGLSSIGFHRSVPGMRPCAWITAVNSIGQPWGGAEWELTRMVRRVREERRTTSRSEITTLTAIPISTFQMMVRKKVSDIRRRSIHARILCVRRRSTGECGFDECLTLGYVLPVEHCVMGELSEEREHDEADAVRNHTLRSAWILQNATVRY